MGYDAHIDNLTIHKQVALADSTVQFVNSDGNDIIAAFNALDSLSATELGYLDTVTAGTVTASKAVVVDANKCIDAMRCTTFYIGTSGAETQVTATGAELNYLDVTTLGTVEASKAVTADANGKITLAKIGSAAASASGLLMGVGTSANPAATSTAEDKFIEVRAKSTATSGDGRLGYFRFDIGGAGGGGECLRAFTDLTAAANTVNGAHISLQADDTGYVTGQGAGARIQLYVGNAAIPANGTYYGALAEIYSEGASSSVAAVTKHAILGVAATGNATGMATVLNAMSFDGTAAADATKMISTVSLAELPGSTVGIAVLVNGTRYYIPAVLASAWD